MIGAFEAVRGVRRGCGAGSGRLQALGLFLEDKYGGTLHIQPGKRVVSGLVPCVVGVRSLAKGIRRETSAQQLKEYDGFSPRFEPSAAKSFGVRFPYVKKAGGR